MPEAQLTEPLDRAAEKGGLEEMFAALEADPQPAAFAQRVYREAIRRGFDTADRQVVIGDGAAWIWNVAGEQFPDAIEIVDIYHAKQHLCDVAKAACKQIGDRLKRAGMRWTVAGANAIIALRCCILSGRFEDFWEQRAANAA